MTASGRTLLVQLYPKGRARCEHCQQKCLYSPVSRISRNAKRAMPFCRAHTVDVVFEDGGLVDSREVAVPNLLDGELSRHCVVCKWGSGSTGLDPQANTPSGKDIQQRRLAASTVTTVLLASAMLHRHATDSGPGNAQQHQLALDCFGSTTERRHIDVSRGSVVGTAGSIVACLVSNMRFHFGILKGSRWTGRKEQAVAATD